MLDVIPEDFKPIMLALLPHRESGAGEIGIVERAQWNRDQPVELAVDLVMHVGSACGTEVEGDAIAAVGGAHPAFRFPLDADLLDGPARLDRERTPRTL